MFEIKNCPPWYDCKNCEYVECPLYIDYVHTSNNNS